MTLPAALKSGPPELPGLMAVSVWIASVVRRQTAAGAMICVPIWETIPEESDSTCPNGAPIAATGSPILTSEELPIGAWGIGSRSGSYCRTAMSSNRSNPRIVAGARAPSERITQIGEYCLTSCGPFRLVRARHHVRGGDDEPPLRVGHEAAAARLHAVLEADEHRHDRAHPRRVDRARVALRRPCPSRAPGCRPLLVAEAGSVLSSNPPAAKTTPRVSAEPSTAATRSGANTVRRARGMRRL